jgi:2-polyprenyl-3-methyl-5-hydroxy-6-metoxy-1,4-benzoquinol methylase
VITYSTPDSNIFTDLRERLTPLLKAARSHSVCDIGGGAHPFLSMEEILADDLLYTLLDRSSDELVKAPAEICKVICDIAGELNTAKDWKSGDRVVLREQFEVIFSVMLAEHIADPLAFHKNVREMLVDGGSAIHLFPTLYTVPFLVNKFLPERITLLLNRILSPAARQTRDKFPAYYRWCRGPLPSAIRRFERLGYEVVEHRGYFGHGYYSRFPLLARVHQWKSDFLERHPVPMLTNYAIVWLRKLSDK